jgi:putative flippase GtrA
VIQSRFVFRVAPAWRTALRFPIIYLVQYLFGVSLLWILVEGLHMVRSKAALAVVIANVPLGFVLSRLLLVRRPR